MGNKPLIVIADDEDQESDSIFGSESFLSERSSLLNSQRSVSNQSEIVDFLLRKSVRDPPMKMKKKIWLAWQRPGGKPATFLAQQPALSLPLSLFFSPT